MDKFEDLRGKTLVKVKGDIGDEVMYFLTDAGEEYRLYHSQDCCESVEINDIVGDLGDLIGSPILLAEEIIHAGTNPEDVIALDYQDSFTWTFYKLATFKGYVTIRWYGESNGYYSERVDFCKVE